MTDVAIRRLAPPDLDDLVEIYLSLAAHHAAMTPTRYPIPDRDAVRARFGPVVEEEEDLHLAEVVGGRVVGQLDAWIDDLAGPGSTRSDDP